MIMKKFVRRMDGRIEWVCEHGIGHPTRDSCIEAVKQLIEDADGHFLTCTCDGCAVLRGKSTLDELVDVWMVHCCDGCCQKKVGDSNKKVRED